MQQVWGRVLDGLDPLDAALEVVALPEADPADHSVGLGGLPNEDGVVQLDAAVMHGPTHNSGAVAALENVLHPSAVARLVMERTDHCLLVDRGAYEFARAHGHEHVELLTPEARAIWLEWKESLSPADDWLPPADTATGRTGASAFRTPRAERAHALARAWRAAGLSVDLSSGFPRLTGTVHCSALGRGGEIACTTTTSGLAFKIPGRVGDSPIVGAGLYCDQDVGSAGSTGRGEANILSLSSFLAVELMRQGAAPREAGLELCRRIVAQVQRQARWQPALLDAEGLPAFNVNFYLLARDGAYAGVCLRDEGGRYAVAQGAAGPRLEALEALIVPRADAQ
jgi:N4-(beta-N-acetylglucosaminyl)-L-asparaginase